MQQSKMEETKKIYIQEVTIGKDLDNYLSEQNQMIKQICSNFNKAQVYIAKACTGAIQSHLKTSFLKTEYAKILSNELENQNAIHKQIHEKYKNQDRGKRYMSVWHEYEQKIIAQGKTNDVKQRMMLILQQQNELVNENDQLKCRRFASIATKQLVALMCLIRIIFGKQYTVKDLLSILFTNKTEEIFKPKKQPKNPYKTSKQRAPQNFFSTQKPPSDEEVRKQIQKQKSNIHQKIGAKVYIGNLEQFPQNSQLQEDEIGQQKVQSVTMSVVPIFTLQSQQSEEIKKINQSNEEKKKLQQEKKSQEEYKLFEEMKQPHKEDKQIEKHITNNNCELAVDTQAQNINSVINQNKSIKNPQQSFFLLEVNHSISTFNQMIFGLGVEQSESILKFDPESQRQDQFFRDNPDAFQQPGENNLINECPDYYQTMILPTSHKNSCQLYDYEENINQKLF